MGRRAALYITVTPSARPSLGSCWLKGGREGDLELHVQPGQDGEGGRQGQVQVQTARAKMVHQEVNCLADRSACGHERGIQEKDQDAWCYGLDVRCPPKAHI